MDQSNPRPPQGGLRIAWFGHAGGRRADGLSGYSAQTVAALERAGAEMLFLHHSGDGDLAPTAATVSLAGWRFKTLTVPVRGTSERIAVALERFRPDVVHCSWSFSLLDGRIGGLARNLGAATVATFHLPYAGTRTGRGRVLQGLYRYHRRNLEAYDRLLVLSGEQQCRLAAAGYPAGRMTLMPNAVDTDAINPGESDLKQRLGARFMVAYLGRLDPEKRVERLVDSFLRRGWPADHVLAIAGAGSLSARLTRRYGGHANVRLLGPIHSLSERVALLRGADIFVQPSAAEGLSLSLLEAMAAGCAVIASEAGDGARALGDAGITIPGGDLEPQLSRAMDRLRADAGERARLGGLARTRVVSGFSLGAQARELIAIYTELRG